MSISSKIKENEKLKVVDSKVEIKGVVIKVE